MPISSKSAIDLFSGCGGLTTGLKQSGFRVLGAIELDPLAVETYRRNHRRTIVVNADIRRVDVRRFARRVALAPGELDLLAACPPCQSFSRLRTLNRSRRVVAPAQKNLLADVLRFIEYLKPRGVMIENVPGLALDYRWPRFLADLRRLGYCCRHGILNVAEYGVPQRRRRLLLLATRSNDAPEFAPSSRASKTVRDAIGTMPLEDTTKDPLHRSEARRKPHIIKLIRRIPKDGGSRAVLSRSQLLCHRRCSGFRDVYGRMAWDKVAPTITGGCINPSKGRFLHPSRDRAVTLREAAILQTFPRTYYFSLSRGRYRAAQMIGNALPPEFIRRHAKALAKSLSKAPASRNPTKIDALMNSQILSTGIVGTVRAACLKP